MTDEGSRFVVAIVGAVVGVLFFVAMTAASSLGQPIGLVIAAGLGALLFVGVDRFTEDDES